MPEHPIQFDFRGELLPAQAEAAARRRLRILEGIFPAVRGWQVSARGQQAADGQGDHAQARVCVDIVGGDTFEAAASGTDALAALRLAFNAIETQLQAETDNARDRATHWLEKVKSRTRLAWSMND